MGFNKRFLTKEIILNTRESLLDRVLNADSVITDDWSDKFVGLYEKGYSKGEILKLLNNG